MRTTAEASWTSTEGNRYNWSWFCEFYAGGKYENNAGENYEFSLGRTALKLRCAVQPEYMDVTVFRTV